MVTIEEAHEILDELAEELPQEFYKELNGGILLLPEVKISREARANDLYTMGEYHYNFSMGRYIVLYFGSFEAVFQGASREKLKRELRHTLRHEFTHHLETLAGEKGLEIKDEENLARYRHNLPMEKI